MLSSGPTSRAEQLRHLRRLQLVCGVALVLLALAISVSPWGVALDGLAYDSLTIARGARPPPEQIVVVAIDEPSFAELGHQWPWPRRVHARLVDALFAAGARAVGFDILFPEPSAPRDDAAFAASLRSHRQVVLAADVNVVEEAAYARQSLVLPAPQVADRDTLVGAVNLPLARDGFVRELILQPGSLPAFSLQLARLTAGEDCCAAGGEPAARVGINFFGPARSLRTVSYYQALDPAAWLPADLLRGKTVLVGLATQSAADPRGKADHFSTPWSRTDGVPVAGVEIHATALANLLARDFIARYTLWQALPVGLLAGLLAVLALRYLRPLAGALLVLGAAAAVLAAAYLLLSGARSYLPLPSVLLALFGAWLLHPLFHYFAEVREKRFIHKAFDSYLNPSVVKALAENPAMLRPGGKTVTGSVLFLDVADFTTLSENYPPDVLIQIINRFLGAMADIVLQQQGMIDKFIGDAVMAAWGAPLEQPDHARRACRAGLAMVDAMEQIAAREQELTGARLLARIGVNSGDMLAGNIGGTRRFDYTVHGNEVNTASRIEGVNKLYGTHLMIGENTARLIGDRFALREIDRVLLKGKRIPIDVFELQGEGELHDPARVQCNRLYAQARELYRQREWAQALALFEQAAQAGDGPGAALAARCREYLHEPPPPDWDGAFVLVTK